MKRLVDARRSAREGKRFHAFYLGSRAARASQAVNPYPQGSEEASCWENGRMYAESER